jgi:predicted membrane chloride channel (bestrophin family)
MTTFLAPTFKRVTTHLIANCFVAWIFCKSFETFPDSKLLKNVPIAPHSLLGSALGLLLVFRTNSAYDRFWEARKLWGSMISKLRLLAHFAHSSMHGLEREHVLTLLTAFPPVFLNHLRGWTRLPKQHDEIEFLVKAVGEDDAVVSARSIRYCSC